MRAAWTAEEREIILAHVNKIRAYARAHPIDADHPVEIPDEQCIDFEIVNCAYVHLRKGEQRLQRLSIAGPILPPDFVTASLASMFGFTGRLNVDYVTDMTPVCPHGCCRALLLTQMLPVEN